MRARTFTQDDVDALIEDRLAKALRRYRRQLDEVAHENDRLRAEIHRLRHRSFRERLIDLFRPQPDRRDQTDS